MIQGRVEKSRVELPTAYLHAWSRGESREKVSGSWGLLTFGFRDPHLCVEYSTATLHRMSVGTYVEKSKVLFGSGAHTHMYDALQVPTCILCICREG